MAAASLLAAAALAGEPQCAHQYETCFAGLDDGEFMAGRAPAVCSLDNWNKREQCMTHCPNSLVITDPPEWRVRLCVQPDFQDPFQPDATMSLDHPLNDKIFDIKAPPQGSRTACRATDFDGMDYSNSLVLTQRGACMFWSKSYNAHLAGAAGSMCVNSDQTEGAAQLFTITRPAKDWMNAPFPMLAKYDGDTLFEALDAGVPLKGKLVFSCDPPPEAPAPEPWHQNCPNPPEYNLDAMCVKEQDNARRLCSRCPLEMTVGSTTVCLFGNRLQPTKKNNLLWKDHTPPFSLSGDMVVVDDGKMAGSGCNADDWAGLAGKLVFLARPQNCLPYQLVRRAEAAQVKGVVILSSSASPVIYMVTGRSEWVDIPVHSIRPDEVGKFLSAVQASGSAHSLGWSLNAADFAVGEMPPLVDPDPTPPPLFEVQAAAVEDVAAPVAAFAMIALSAVFLLALLGLLGRGWAKASESVDAAKAGGFSLPLGTATTLLTLLAILLCLVVAVVLVADAGSTATTTAIQDGKSATEQSYNVAVDNVNDLAKQLRLGLLGRVEKQLDQTLNEGRDLSSSVAAIYDDWMDMEWASFYKLWPLFTRVTNPKGHWWARVNTVNYFWCTTLAHTDNRPSGRPDPHNQTVEESGNGKGYAMLVYFWISAFKGTWFWHDHYEPPQYEAWHLTVGQEVGDPASALPTVGDGSVVWNVPEDHRPELMYGSATQQYVAGMGLNLLRPLYNKAYKRLGLSQYWLPMTTVQQILRDALDANTGNATVAILTRKKTVLATNMLGTDVWMVRQKVQQHPYHSSWPLDKIPNIELNLLATLMNEGNTWAMDRPGSLLSEQRDQRDVFSHRKHMKWAIAVDQDTGLLKDSSNDPYPMSGLEGTSGYTVTTDAESGRKVMTFDGAGALGVHRIFTTDHPRIAATAFSNPDGTWNNTMPELQEGTMTYHGFTCPLYNNGFGKVSCCLKGTDLGVYDLAYATESEPVTISLRVKPAKVYTRSLERQAPRLFESAAGGNANFRLMADGTFIMSVFTGRCLVQGPAEGLPAGVWSTIAVAHDQFNKRCHVWINGVKHGSEVILDGSGSDIYEMSHVAANFWEGSMDHLVRHTFVFTDFEAREMHKMLSDSSSPTFDMPVDNKKWYADVKSFNRNTPTQSGVDWLLAVLLPVEDVMREVEKNNMVLQMNLQAQEKATNDKLENATMVAVAIASAIALLLSIFFILFSDTITQPFAVIAATMMDCARMRIDEVPAVDSKIMEMNAITQALVIMVANLKEYKSYMPASVIMDDDDDESVAEESVSMSQSQASRMSKKSKKSSMRSQSRASSRSSKSLREAAHAKKGNLMAIGLTKKKVSLCVVNFVGWLERVKSESLDRVCQIHAEMTAMCLQVFMTSKGVPETFSGDRFVCSWNAAKPIGTHKVAATNAGVSIKNMCKEVHAPGISAAVCGGDAKVGNLGTETMRKFSFVTPMMSWALALERLAKVKGLPLLTDQQTYEDVKTGYLTRIVDQVLFAKYRGEKKIMVVQVVEEKASGETDEWMYELEDAEKSDPFSAYNKFAQAVFAEDWDSAKDLVDKARAVCTDELSVKDCPAEVFERLTKALDAASFVPQPLTH